MYKVAYATQALKLSLVLESAISFKRAAASEMWFCNANIFANSRREGRSVGYSRAIFLQFYWKIINDTLEKQGNQEHLKSEFLKEMEDCTKKKEKRKLKQVIEKWGLPVFTGFLSNILSNETIWFGLLKWLKQ